MMSSIYETNMGLGLTTPRSQPEKKSKIGYLTKWATQAPHNWKKFLRVKTVQGWNDKVITTQPIRMAKMKNSDNIKC